MFLYSLSVSSQFVALREQIMEVFNKVGNVFSAFGFSDLLDILFVAVLIFGAIRIIRETRAVQLLKGIFSLVLIYAVVSVFKMESSTYIMKTLFSNGLVIVIVLFTPEIRHALEQIGKANVKKLGIFNIMNTELQIQNQRREKLIDATCRACAQMKDQKIGALIVFEKEVLLGDIIATGTIVDAEPSSEIIGNVFFPKSPLHDGAMVARDGKVYAAGCILPLTKNNAISSALGTRHRAALGVSEQSDAIVIVVSEETGVISVAIGGKLRRNLSAGDLRDILTDNFLAINETEEDTFISKMRRRFKRDGK